ncbi:hypothetical protein MRB53_008955 [Persea americana]|uniref:Uncharacterized protein n=1 Tax=Persea americana TaxID=3435 RepID=A0ACC2LMR4_PERAE|nr:hypothetical protein MRB53_008955 [Persea americana]
MVHTIHHIIALVRHFSPHPSQTIGILGCLLRSMLHCIALFQLVIKLRRNISSPKRRINPNPKKGSVNRMFNWHSAPTDVLRTTNLKSLMLLLVALADEN